MPLYMLLFVNPGPTPLSDAERASVLAQFGQVHAELKAKGKFISASRLRPPAEAKTLRTARDGRRMVVDGPFTETKEAVGGYDLIDCASEAEALEWAKKFPSIFAIEVRALFEM